MPWRAVLVVAYGVGFGALLAMRNFHSGMSDAPFVVVWALGPVVGFLVGRWWVALAVVGVLIGHVVGWDPAENDGNPALWWPLLIWLVILTGTPLLLGVGLARLRGR